MKLFFYRFILNFILKRLTPGLQQDLALEVAQSNLSAMDSVKAYKFRKRILNRVLRAYPILNSHESLRIYGFYNILKSIATVEGDIVEAGVGRGRFLVIFLHAVSYFKLNKKVYGFDSFEGFPVAHEKDFGTRVTALEKIQGWDDIQPEMLHYVMDSDSTDEGSVSLFKEFKPELKLVKGYFSDTLEKGLPAKISFLHLDADLYESTHDALRYSIPKLSKGAIVIFDELHEKEKWPGVQKAFDELLAPLGYSPEWFPEVQRFGVKIK